MSVEPVRSQDSVYRVQVSSELQNLEELKKKSEERFGQREIQKDNIVQHESVNELEKQSAPNPDGHSQNKKEQRSRHLNKLSENVTEVPPRIFSPRGGDFLDIIV